MSMLTICQVARAKIHGISVCELLPPSLTFDWSTQAPSAPSALSFWSSLFAATYLFCNVCLFVTHRLHSRYPTMLMRSLTPNTPKIILELSHLTRSTCSIIFKHLFLSTSKQKLKQKMRQKNSSGLFWGKTLCRYPNLIRDINNKL